MDNRGYTLRSELCSMSAKDVDKLIDCGDGDCALLDIYLLRRGVTSAGELCRALGMTRARMAAAADKLRAMGLLAGGELGRDGGELPEYTAEEIVRRSGEDEGFMVVLAECERVLGHTLSGADTRALFGIYDYLGLPADVILLLLNHCSEECRRKYGPGRVPTMRQLEKEAYIWVNREIMTLEQAEEYIRSQAAMRDGVERLRRALGIRDRQLSPTERKYIEGWLALGYSTEAIEMAYDRTVTNTGSLKWSYMDSIIRSWHEKGLVTCEEIEKGDVPRRRQAQPRRQNENGGTTMPSSEDFDRMKQLYEKLKKS